MAFTALAVKDASGNSKNMGAFQDASSNNYGIMVNDVPQMTYRGGVNRATLVATPTVGFVMAGNATNTVRLRRLILSGGATSAGEMPFTVSKCSSAGTLGSATLTSMTAVPLDSAMAAAGSAFKYVQTANYGTPPAVVGIIHSGELEMAALTTGVAKPQEIVFGVNCCAVVLRGTAECITVEFLGTAIPSGGKHSAVLEWVEDAS